MQLPNELKEYIKNKGYSCLNGYIKFLNDEEIILIKEILKPYSDWNDGIPFAVTAFGDVLAWVDDKYVYKYQLCMGKREVLFSGFKFFFIDIEDLDFQKEYFDIDLYNDAIIKFGRLGEEECFILEPIPALGGALDIKYVAKGNLVNYIKFLIEANY